MTRRPHSLELRPARYWACKYPERPSTYLTSYCEYCPKCLILMRVAYQTGHLGPNIRYETDDHKKSILSTVEFFTNEWDECYDRAVAGATEA